MTESLSTVGREALGLTVEVDADWTGLGFDGLLGLAVRDNPRRAQLLVSRVLAKHVPVAPERLLDVSANLARLVEREVQGPALLLGFCETATGLAQHVATAMGVDHFSTTRRPGEVAASFTFEEEHSHASTHQVALRDPSWLRDERTLVLVDDEVSTGRTVLNVIEELERLCHRPRYVVATLTDVRSQEDRHLFTRRAEQMGVDVRVVALLLGSVTLPEDVLGRAAAFRSEASNGPLMPPSPTGRVVATSLTLPGGVYRSGRHGVSASILKSHARGVEAFAGALAGHLGGLPSRVLVVGDEELMGLPVEVAAALRRTSSGSDVLVQSTTRSPVVAVDEPGYAIRRSLSFPAVHDPSRTSFLHNVTDPLDEGFRGYDLVVVLAEDAISPTHPLLVGLSGFASTVLAVHLEESA